MTGDTDDAGNGACMICMQRLCYPGYSGQIRCPACGAVYEYEEGAQLVLDDELREAIKAALKALGRSR